MIVSLYRKGHLPTGENLAWSFPIPLLQNTLTSISCEPNVLNSKFQQQKMASLYTESLQNALSFISYESKCCKFKVSSNKMANLHKDMKKFLHIKGTEELLPKAQEI